MDGISSANAILGTAVIVGNAAAKLAHLYADWKDVPAEVTRAKREVQNAKETLNLIDVASLTALGKVTAEKWTCLVPGHIETIEECVNRLRKLTPRNEHKIPALERSKLLFNKRKWDETRRRLEASTSALADCMMCCMQIHGNKVSERTAGKVDILGERVERLLREQNIILQHISSIAKQESDSQVLSTASRLALQASTTTKCSDEAACYATDVHREDRSLDVDTALSLFDPQRKQYRYTSSKWLSVNICESKANTTWQFEGRFPLPTFLQARLSASIAFQTRANQWCLSNIKIQCLGMVRKIDCASFLWQACLRGEEAKVKYLINEELMDPSCILDKGIDRGKHNNRMSACCQMFTDGDTLLTAAVASGNRRLVRYLIQAGLDPAQKNDHMRGPVFLAFRLGYIDIARDLTDRGAPLDDPDKNGITVLDLLIQSTPADDGPSDKRVHSATNPAEIRASELLTFLIGREFAHFGGVLMDGEIDLPILRAAKKGLQLLYSKLSQVMLLLRAQGQACVDPLELFENASRRPCLPIMREVISKHPDLDITYGGFNGEPVLITIINKWERVSWNTFETLLHRGVDVNARSRSGRTALHHAAMRDTPVQVLEKLVEFGADVNVRCKLGKTPLHQAASECNAPAVRFLVNNAAEVDCKSPSGHTPLHAASSLSLARWNNLSPQDECEALETLGLLLEAGADPLLRAYGSFREVSGAFSLLPAPPVFAAKPLLDVGVGWLSPGDLALNQSDRPFASRIYRQALSQYMADSGKAHEICFDEKGAIFWDAIEVQ